MSKPEPGARGRARPVLAVAAGADDRRRRHFLHARARDPPGGWRRVAAGGRVAALVAGWRRSLPRAVVACAVAAALGFAAAQLATWRAPAADGGAVARGHGGRRRACGRTAAAGPAGDAGGGAAGRRRAVGEPAAHPPARRPTPPRSPPATAAGARPADAAGAAGLSGRLGCAARRLLPRLRRLRHRARAPPCAAGRGDAAGPARPLQRLRETIAARIGAVLSGSTGAIATTMLTGITSAIPEADRQAFRDSGLAHLLAIAGLHVGIVMGLVFGGHQAGAGAVGMGGAALADQADRGPGGAGGGGRLHAADRRPPAGAAQLRHGRAVHPRRGGRAAGDVAARPGAGHGGAGAAGAAPGHGRELPDELFRRAGADRRLRGGCALAAAPARRGGMAAAAAGRGGGAGADRGAGRHVLGAVRRRTISARRRFTTCWPTWWRCR